MRLKEIRYLPLFIIMAFLAGCNGNTESLQPRPEEAPPGPAPDVTIDVYALEQVTAVGLPFPVAAQNYLNEYNFYNYNYSFIYENKSYRTVNGVRTVDISISAPIASNQNNISAPNTGSGYYSLPLCNSLITLDPGARCEFLVGVTLPAPAAGVIAEDQLMTMQVSSIEEGVMHTNSVSLKRVFSKPAGKKIITTMLEAPFNYGDALLQESGLTKGMALGIIDVDTNTATYVGACEIMADGSVGNPRGVHPFVDQHGTDFLEVVGNKVFFAGRGCSWNGSSLVHERYGMWEFDSLLPKSPTNPRRISRDASGVAANAIGGSIPTSNMKSLNGKLYFSSVSELGSVLAPWGDDRHAFFEYDTTQAFAPGTNPREIVTGYAFDVATGSTSWPTAVQIYNDKVYFIGQYYTESPNSVLSGVIEYDPALPMTLNNAGLVESNDNPRFVWGYDHSDYFLHEFQAWGNDGFYIDNEVIIMTSIPPLDPTNPAHTQSPNGREPFFIRRSDGFVTKHDICPGACFSEAKNIVKVGNSFVMTANTSVTDRTVISIRRDLDGGGLPIYTSVTAFDTNTAGSELGTNRESFKYALRGSDLYFPLLETNSIRNLYLFDDATQTVSPVFSGEFRGTANSFQRLQVMNNGDIMFRNQRLNNSSGANIFDPDSAQTGTTPNDANANHFAKMRSFPRGPVAEDSNFYYYTRSVTCSPGVLGWYIDISTKNKDVPLALSSAGSTNACAETRKYVAGDILIIQN